MSDTTVPEPLEAKEFHCEICQKPYKKRYHLLDHARRVHGGKERHDSCTSTVWKNDDFENILRIEFM